MPVKLLQEAVARVSFLPTIQVRFANPIRLVFPTPQLADERSTSALACNALADQNASGGILMNGTSGDKKALKAQEGPRRCSFKEPLPVRPDKHDLNRRSSITMGVAARASLLSSQNSNNSSFAAVPDGYNPDPEQCDFLVFPPSSLTPD